MATKIPPALLLATAIAATIPSSAALAAEHHGKRPLSVHAFNTPCVHFRLDGVGVADPAVGTTPWFGLSKSHPNFSELFAILVSAKASGRTIGVHTDGGTACGYPSVISIDLE